MSRDEKNRQQPYRLKLVDETALSGLKDIAQYVGQTEAMIRYLVKCEGFPATKIGGNWISDTKLIVKWRRKKIIQAQIKAQREHKKAVNE